MPLLETKRLTKKFFKLTAVDRLNFQVEEGEIVAVLGPNGSGKSTLFNCITHVHAATTGAIFYKEQDISRLSLDKIARLGIGRTFQLIQLFLEMTVLENMLLSVQEHGGNLLSKLFQVDERTAVARAMEILSFLNIDHLKDEVAANLSYGQQKLLDFGMVLMPNPDLILLDEPTSGVEVEMREKIMDYILKLNEQGHTIVVIEHNMDVVMNLCERIIVLDYGKKIAEGTPEEIQNNQTVINAYFGVEE